MFFNPMDRRAEPDKFVIGCEQHVNGVNHYHVYVHYTTAVRTRNPRYFDLHPEQETIDSKRIGRPKKDDDEDVVYHPNIKTFGNKRNDPEIERWISYCMKNGNFSKAGFLENLFTFKHYENYRKKKADLEMWMKDAQAQNRRDPFPFNLPDGTIIQKPKLDIEGDYDKKRNYLFVGPPDVGKTRFFMKEFKGSRTYMRPTTQYPYEYGSYRQEQVIIWDDIWPKIEEILDVTGVFEMEKQTYGPSRYNVNHWKTSQARVVIWLLNPQNMPSYTLPGDKNYEVFNSRFNTMVFPKPGGVDYTQEEMLKFPVHLHQDWVMEGYDYSVWVNPNNGRAQE